MKDCPTYPGYSIVEEGQVFSHRRRFGKGKGNGGGVVIDPEHCHQMNPYPGEGGYMYVSISTERGQRSVAIHSLLMDAFVGPKPDGLEVRHLDGNPLNNDLSNIRYGTRKENADDRVKHGRQRGRELLNDAEVRSIRRLRHKGLTIESIANRIGVSETCVIDCAKRRTYVDVH